MEIIRAEHLGMCFGVRDAIELAKRTALHKPLSILGELVHNDTVLDQLRAEGIGLARHLSEAHTPTIMITAHGASDKAISAAEAAGKQVLQATCPLVHAAHRALKGLVDAGYHPVVIGKKDHVEVRGMTEDLADVDVVLTDAEILDLKPRNKFGVVAQTTQPLERVTHLVGLLRWRFQQADVQFIDTVCRPTKQRQSAAVELASGVDVMIVAGGRHSNNTRELARTCARLCPQVYQVESARDLKEEWFHDARRAGLTAGTSTPDDVINEIENRMREIADRMAPRTEVPREASVV
jgi:4-hydroxy-3-methylbut-2-enyl diphosphate reductase